MSTLESAHDRATEKHVFTTENVRAVGALRDLFDFSPGLSDDSVLMLIRIRRAANDNRDGLVDNLLAIVAMCDGDPIGGSYPPDYEARAHAHYQGRRQ